MSWTAKEVRDAAQTNEHPIPLRVRDMLNHLADRIEADERAVPFAWLTRQKHNGSLELAEPNGKATNPEYWTDAFPVFTRPPAQAAQVDADRIAEETMQAWGDRVPKYSFDFRGLIADGIRRAGIAAEPVAHPHSPDAADSVPVDARAREMLASEFERGHPATQYPEYARIARGSHDILTMAAIRAISAALSEHQADSGRVDAVVQVAEKAFWPAYLECKRKHGSSKDAHATGMRAAIEATLTAHGQGEVVNVTMQAHRYFEDTYTNSLNPANADHVFKAFTAGFELALTAHPAPPTSPAGVPDVWVVQDGTGEPVYCASYPLACREHISEAINQYGLEEARSWKVIHYSNKPSSPAGDWLVTIHSALKELETIAYRADRTPVDQTEESINAQTDRIRAAITAQGHGEVGVGVDTVPEGAHVCVRLGDTLVYSQFHRAPSSSPAGVPDGLLEHLREAFRRIEDNHAPRRIPAEPGDVDLALAEVIAWLEGKPAPFWVSPAAPSATEGGEVGL